MRVEGETAYLTLRPSDAALIYNSQENFERGLERSPGNVDVVNFFAATAYETSVPYSQEQLDRVKRVEVILKNLPILIYKPTPVFKAYSVMWRSLPNAAAVFCLRFFKNMESRRSVFRLIIREWVDVPRVLNFEQLVSLSRV